jgi:phenylpropionate dioxygenase-like ring-hydroxylating dioxygenase large terminal subunit
VRDVKPRLRGRSFLIRWADDFIWGLEREDDAKRVMAALPKRFNLFKLTIHPEKTAMIRFRRPPKQTDRENGTFDFLGFTHYWAKSRKGFWIIKRKTAKKRLRRAMKSIWQWCRRHRHDKLTEQHKMLCLKLRGHYQYYGIRNNYGALSVVMWRAKRAWQYWLSRRGGKHGIRWDKFKRLMRKFSFPAPRIYHAI